MAVEKMLLRPAYREERKEKKEAEAA